MILAALLSVPRTVRTSGGLRIFTRNTPQGSTGGSVFAAISGPQKTIFWADITGRIWIWAIFCRTLCTLPAARSSGPTAIFPHGDQITRTGKSVSRVTGTSFRTTIPRISDSNGPHVTSLRAGHWSRFAILPCSRPFLYLPICSTCLRSILRPVRCSRILWSLPRPPARPVRAPHQHRRPGRPGQSWLRLVTPRSLFQCPWLHRHPAFSALPGPLLRVPFLHLRLALGPRLPLLPRSPPPASLGSSPHPRLSQTDDMKAPGIQPGPLVWRPPYVPAGSSTGSSTRRTEAY